MEVAQDRLVDLHDLAELLELPRRWLKIEAEQGRIPSLKVNREYMFNAIAVRDALFARAAATVESQTESQVEAREQVAVPPS